MCLCRYLLTRSYSRETALKIINCRAQQRGAAQRPPVCWKIDRVLRIFGWFKVKKIKYLFGSCFNISNLHNQLAISSFTCNILSLRVSLGFVRLCSLFANTKTLHIFQCSMAAGGSTSRGQTHHFGPWQLTAQDYQQPLAPLPEGACTSACSEQNPTWASCAAHGRGRQWLIREG